MNKKIIILISLLILVTGVLLYLTLREQPTPPQVQPTTKPSSSTSLLPIVPKNIQALPTLPGTQGGGVDINSRTVKESMAEIERLKNALPYKKEVVLSTGQSVEILIPPRDSFSNPWTLSILIAGINFNITPQEPEYQKEKKSFLEAASLALSWVEQNGADPKSIYISWGERAFIQDKAESWIRN